MPANNPFLDQLENLRQRIENDNLDPVEIITKVFQVSKKDVMQTLETERVMLHDLCMAVANMRLEDPLEILANPAMLVTKLETMVGEYAQQRYKAMILKRGEFEFSEALMDSAIKQDKGEGLH